MHGRSNRQTCERAQPCHVAFVLSPCTRHLVSVRCVSDLLFPLVPAPLDLGVYFKVYTLFWEVEMDQTDHVEHVRIGAFARRAHLSADTIRYYERLGLLQPPTRAANGYRAYGEADLRRVQFIRRSKLLGLSLEEIGTLLGLAEEGACQPLRQQVVELLRQKIDACEAQLTELAAFKANLEERYNLAIARQTEPGCDCAAFPATCQCLPIQLEDTPFLPIQPNLSTPLAPSPLRPAQGDKQNRSTARAKDA